MFTCKNLHFQAKRVYKKNTFGFVIVLIKLFNENEVKIIL